MHIGNLRTAIYNYLFAKKHGGSYILRIEDTDQERQVEGGVKAIIDVLNRVGLAYDEGPMIQDDQLVQKGDHGPYIQSMRLATYKKYANELLAQGNAYHCFCKTEELASQRQQQQLMKLATKYNRQCLSLTKEEITERLSRHEPFALRMKIPEGETAFEDVIRGKITIKNEELDDQVILKSDGFPTYHLANIVDDHLMEITHVIRGEEWISSTPKHVILYQMFGWTAPLFAHAPLLLNADHSKLSKRQGDVAAEDYLAKGYLPEALLNFLSLLGYNPKGDQEIYTMQEMIELFDLSKVNPSGAVVNFEKLDWMNGVYLRQKSGAELETFCRPFLEAAHQTADSDLLQRVLEIEKGRMVRLTDIVELFPSYQELSNYDASLLVWKKADATDAKNNLLKVQSILEAIAQENWTIVLLEQHVKESIEREGLTNGNVLWPLRVALSGKGQSPSPFELAWALGKTETLRRVQTAIEKLS